MTKTVIGRTKNILNLNIKELFLYKDLLRALIYRDIKVRYVQTLLGPLWVFFQPLVTLLIFIVIFDKALKVDTASVPYPLFALAGMCGWTYFSSVVNQAGTSIIGAQNMIQKIYFPRLVIPLSKALVCLIDFAISLIIFFIAMFIYGHKPGMSLLFLPLFIFSTIITALAFSLWISALTVRYRDLQIVVPYLIQAGLYITPIAYPADIIPENYQILYHLNPMTGIVQGFRWTLLDMPPPDTLNYLSSAITSLLFLSGLFYFKKMERIMADIL